MMWFLTDLEHFHLIGEHLMMYPPRHLMSDGVCLCLSRCDMCSYRVKDWGAGACV